jgi:hypothetical protein
MRREGQWKGSATRVKTWIQYYQRNDMTVPLMGTEEYRSGKKNATQMVGFLHEESEGPNHLGSVTFWKS